MYLSLKFFPCIIILINLTYLSLGISQNYHGLNQPQPYEEDPSLCLTNNILPPKPGWIDPFDMLGESHTHDSIFVQSEVEISTLQKRCSSYEIYLRRFVNMFLIAVDLKDGSVDSQNLVKLEFLIDGNDVNILKEYGEGENNDAKIEFVSDIFTKIFTQKTLQDKKMFKFSDFFVWFQKAFFKIISSPEWTVLSSVVLLLILTLWFVYHTQSYRLAIFTVLLTIFLAGFGFTWIRMYEEKEVERFVNIQVNGEIPKHCSSQAQTMAWYQHMYYRMFGVNCQEFYKIKDVRPIVKISPTDVLTETFFSMIVKPATHLGNAYGNFVTGLIGCFPWWLKPVALPLSFIIPIVFTTILLTFLFGYRLSFSITGFHLIPTWTDTSHPVAGQGNRYVEDFPRKEFNSSQQNNPQIPFLDSNTELFVMNWKGLKKLSSSNLLDKTNEKNRKEEEEVINEDGYEMVGDNENMIESLREFEKFVESVETQKCIEERKKKSIHTSTEGENSLTKRRSDSLNAKMTNSTDDLLSSDSGTSVTAGKEKDFKSKTS